MRSSFAIASLLSVASLVSAVDIKVQVGPNSTLTYEPNTVTAAVGDTVTFQFHSKNHTATQSTFTNPCTKMDGGFTSGFQPVAADATQLPQYTVTVNATTPTWVYCGQKLPVNHCQAAMVFAINAPTSGNTYAAFQAAAKASGGASSTSASSAASGTASYPGTSASATAPAGSSAAGASGSSTATGTGSASTAASTGNAALKVGGSAAGALTAMALLVGLAL